MERLGLQHDHYWPILILAMLDVAFALLAFAASLGAFLALLHEGYASRAVVSALRPRGRGLGLIHGGLGGAGLLLLLGALYSGTIHPAAGVVGFGVIAAWLIGIALLFGLAILTTVRARRGNPSALIAIHAMLAISGIVVLMALIVLG
ncbi:MAG: hypothetical protein ACREDC_11310 [Bradyrhizobium sp.]